MGANAINAAIDGADSTTGDLINWLDRGVKNEVKPKRVPAGSFALRKTNEINRINSMKAASKWGGRAANIAGVVVDTAVGMYDNYQNGYGFDSKKMWIDAGVDVVFSGGITAVSTTVGSLIGTPIPVVGNIVGGIAGFTVGWIISKFTDGLRNDTKVFLNSW